MNHLDSALISALVRIDRRLPDVRDTMLDALYVLRRQRWTEPLGKVRHAQP